MKLETIRKLIGKEEVDYPLLMSFLKNYVHPRDKITGWLKSGELIRVKKGLYIFGENIALAPYSPEILANLIYGPSAISLTYALAYYGLIPEKVANVTSITNKRNKVFETPIGNFMYRYLPADKYHIGITLQNTTAGQSFLIASPEKSLCDQIYLIDKDIPLDTLEQIEFYLFHDLRIDESNLKKLKRKHMEKINSIYLSKKIEVLTKFLKKWSKR